jgi:glycosyltransferase involved in cell wall biosynthesis
MNFPKITVVTPSFNQAAYLEQTIRSVIDQDYPNLEYIIIDGGSTDGSLDIIKKYEKYFAYCTSEKDKGLYDALMKGFSRSSGEIMGWINSDDLLHRKSLFVLANIFENNKHVNWVQGHPTVYDETGMVVDNIEPVYSRFYFYLKQYTTKYIQQESTFWRRNLWDKAGAYISQDYKYAGDFELWMRFFNHDLLYPTTALIGGYRVRQTQLSRSHQEEYFRECNDIIDKLKIKAGDRKQLQKIRFLEQRLMKIRMLRPFLKSYSTGLYGYQPPLRFDFQNGTFHL